MSPDRKTLKEPFVLEFFDLEGRHTWSESDLEAGRGWGTLARLAASPGGVTGVPSCFQVTGSTARSPQRANLHP
jgi:hypothetical protein